MAQPFSSGNPVVDALFSREFAQRQAEQAALEAAATRGVQREQIQAQSQLAQAQQRSAAQQQEYNNLFRMQDLQQRADAQKSYEALTKRQLDIQEKGGTRPAIDEETRKRQIIDANATAINDAQRANALYKINFEKSLAEAKAKRTGFLWTGLGSTAGVYDDPKTTDYKKVQNETFERVRQQLLSEKGGALNNLIPDPDTFVFKPVQYDETGKAIALPLPTPTPTAPSGDVGAAAGLGPATPAPTAPTPGLSLGDNIDASLLFRAVEPAVRQSIGNAADMFGVQAPKMVTIPTPSGNLELSETDALEAQRQLQSVPIEQRAATAAAIRDQLIKSGRARLRMRIPQMSNEDMLMNRIIN